MTKVWIVQTPTDEDMGRYEDKVIGVFSSYEAARRRVATEMLAAEDWDGSLLQTKYRARIEDERSGIMFWWEDGKGIPLEGSWWQITENVIEDEPGDENEVEILKGFVEQED